MPLRDCRAQGPGRAARGALATHPFCALACVLTVPPLPATRCGAAPIPSFQTGYPVGRTRESSVRRTPTVASGLTALCGESQLCLARGGAVATRPSPRPRPSAKPQAPGSAPSPRSGTAARQAQAAASIGRWSGPASRRRRRPAHRRRRCRMPRKPPPCAGIPMMLAATRRQDPRNWTSRTRCACNASIPSRACVRAERAPLPATRCGAAPTPSFQTG